MWAFLWRALILLVAFLLIGLFIWFAGPYFGFGAYHPLQPVWVRIAAVAAIVAAWLLVKLWKQMRAFQLSDRLMAAVAVPRRANPEPVSPEAAKLRERFDEAVARLSARRRSGHSLYELPWYVIIGAPGSGKTTALVNSGLNFALDQKGSRAALRGIGGTRNCDWWFTDEAVFLDTAGRYTTQDSDAASDSVGWKEFLGLLKKYRARRPINGVILTISAPDLLMRDQAVREAHVDAARQRLDELNRELRIQLPVYLAVTKCDLIAGFTEYFEDLDAKSRSQVWGVTFPYEQSVANEGPERIAGEFDALLARLNERVLARISQVRDVRRRGRVFGFPLQLATMREPIAQYVNDVFAGSRFDRQVLLRGVYFTSGTQEGTPFDRMLANIGRQFGATEAVMPSSGPGKSYFTADLLQQVIIAESGLAGVNRKLEARTAAAQLAAYAAMGVIAAIGVTMASISYARNRQFLDATATQIAAVEATPRVNSSSALEAIVARLDAIRVIVDAAERYRLDTGWPLRWGLYQGRVIGNPARAAYSHELDAVVLPRLGAMLAERMLQYRSQPVRLSAYLKAYLMLGMPAHLDKAYLRAIADAEWKAASSAQTGARLTTHFNYLLDEGDGLRRLGLNDQLVGQARVILSREQLAGVLYENLKRGHDAATADAPRLDQLLGFDAQKLLRRTSGTPLSEPLSPFYTPAVFKQVVQEGQSGLLKQLDADGWIWGDSLAASRAKAQGMLMQVLDLYEQDYIKHWEGLLADLEFIPQTTVADTSDALRVLSAPSSSPLRNLVRVIAANTLLVEPPPAAPAAPAAPATPSVLERAKQNIGKFLNPGDAEAGAAPADAGRLVTTRFDWARAATAGEPGPTPLGAVLQTLATIQQQLAAVGDGVTDVDVAQVMSSQAFRAQLDLLRQEADALPSELARLVMQIARVPRVVVTGGATARISEAYTNQVVRPCLARIGNRYPFAAFDQPQVQMDAFGEVFGYGGIFDSFFTAFLADLVDTRGESWAWRPDAVKLSPGVLEQFQAARLIRAMFFEPGAKTPKVSFSATVTEMDAATTRFVLEIDGARLAQKPGPPASNRMIWPGPTPGANKVAFEATLYQPQIDYPTPWGWLRLVDTTQQGRADDQQRIRLYISNPPHYAAVLIEPIGAYPSPFADGTWRQFSCTS